jgi:Two component regulator propeller
MSYNRAVSPHWLRMRAVICGAVLVLSAKLACGSTNSGWFTRVWQTDEGLPNNRVNSVVQGGDGFLWVGNAMVTWTSVGGLNYVVQSASGLGGSFTDLSPVIQDPGSGESILTFLDAGATTNSSARFYRVRIGP